MARTNLLCTFAHRKDLTLIIDYVKQSYVIVEKKIFVFNDADKPNDLYVTYNVDPTEDYRKTPNTILPLTLVAPDTGSVSIKKAPNIDAPLNQ